MIPVQFAKAITQIDKELKLAKTAAIGYMVISILFLAFGIYSMCTGGNIEKYVGVFTNGFCMIYCLIRACLTYERTYNLNLMLEMMQASEKDEKRLNDKNCKNNKTNRMVRVPAVYKQE